MAMAEGMDNPVNAAAKSPAAKAVRFIVILPHIGFKDRSLQYGLLAIIHGRRVCPLRSRRPI
jgi:hypothetical protein